MAVRAEWQGTYPQIVPHYYGTLAEITAIAGPIGAIGHPSDKLGSEITFKNGAWTGVEELTTALRSLYSRSPSALSIADLELGTGVLVNITSPYYTGTIPSNSMVHTSVLHIPEGIAGGFQYIMALTPFDGIEAITENPCIFVSNDLLNWAPPEGLTNPIFAKPTGGYNSDVHLYKHTDGYIYLMFRDRIVGVESNIYVSRTLDGIHWEPKVKILSADLSTIDWASPSYWHDGTKWIIQSHDIVDVNYPIKRLEKTGNLMTSWSSVVPTVVTIPHPLGSRWWHSDVHRMPDGRLIGLAIDYVTSGGTFWLWQSDDGVNWSVRRLSRSRSYRSCLILRECDMWMMGVWIAPAVDYTEMRLHKILSGAKERRRQRAIAHALTAYSLNIIDDQANLITHADGFLGGVAALTTPWTQATGSTLNRTGTVCVAATTAISAAYVETGTIDHTVQAKFNTYSGTGAMWMVARYVDTNNHLLVGIADATGALAIRAVVAGVATVDARPVPNPVLSIPTTIRIEVDGLRLRVFIDGFHCIELPIPAALAAGTKAGLYISGSTTNAFDEFVARPL